MLLPFKATSAFATAILLLLLVLLHLPRGATSIPTHEVDTMLSTLHSRGPYNLIANAIATSDLRFDILHSSSFTLFAPPDSSLFHLALTLPSAAYVSALRLHSSPHRYSSSDLHHLLSSSSSSSVRAVPTLLKPRSLRLHSSGAVLALDNVEVSFPGIFYSHSIAVHGISGAISLRDERHISPPPSFESSIPGLHDRSHGRGHGHGHFFRIPRFSNRTDNSLKNHEDVAVSPAGFSPVAAPALMLKKPASSISFAPEPAPALDRLDESTSDIPGNVEGVEILRPSTTMTAASEEVEGDPADLDTLDEAYIWNSGDIDSLFDEYL
ncbi:hypothetical protein MLD38_013405 [Melastoma candidum]|uniref:Uncharacterized protein n=1 Tax=Melastoma candidum TaxID=119954 RepID=A0ACB9RAM0_9MYRT|nr:hypothetical protein MLD38_013405 [Melastoma candidum]